jgi:hypothetical protein
MPGRSFFEEVTLTPLIDIQGDDIHVRAMIGPVPPIAVQEAVHNMLGVEIFFI